MKQDPSFTYFQFIDARCICECEHWAACCNQKTIDCKFAPETENYVQIKRSAKNWKRHGSAETEPEAAYCNLAEYLHAAAMQEAVVDAAHTLHCLRCVGARVVVPSAVHGASLIHYPPLPRHQRSRVRLTTRRQQEALATEILHYLPASWKCILISNAYSLLAGFNVHFSNRVLRIRFIVHESIIVDFQSTRIYWYIAIVASLNTRSSFIEVVRFTHSRIRTRASCALRRGRAMLRALTPGAVRGAASSKQLNFKESSAIMGALTFTGINYSYHCHNSPFI